jgi:biotin carboxylase
MPSIGATSASAELIGYPLVVKPLSQRASRGVSIVRSCGELSQAIVKAREYGKSFLMEQCLIGTEHSVEIILGLDGNAKWFNIVDRVFDYYTSTGIEIGHVNPTSLDLDTQQDLFFMALETSSALGVEFGAFKIDAIVTTDGPKILECTTRLSGGFDSQGTSPLTNRYPIRILLGVSCGLPYDLYLDTDGYAACAAILARGAGTVSSVPGETRERLLRYYPNATDVIWSVRPGQKISPATHNAERAGFVLAHGRSYVAAWNNAKACADFLSKELIVK